MSCSVFGERLRGTGIIAKNIEQLFSLSCRKYSLDTSKPELDTTQFRRYTASQQELFI
jgi:hypothetical protein